MGNIDKLAVSSKYLSGKSVYIGNESYVNDALNRGGAVVLRLYTDEWHYVLLTGIDGKNVRMFDPYYCDRSMNRKISSECWISLHVVTESYRGSILIRRHLTCIPLDRTMGGKLSFYLMKRQDLRKKRPSNTLFRGESRK